MMHGTLVQVSEYTIIVIEYGTVYERSMGLQWISVDRTQIKDPDGEVWNTLLHFCKPEYRITKLDEMPIVPEIKPKDLSVIGRKGGY